MNTPAGENPMNFEVDMEHDEVDMQHDSAAGSDPIASGEPAKADDTRLVPATRPPALPASSDRVAARSGLSQITRMLDEAAGLALDALDVLGDAIAKRIGLRGKTTS